MKSRKEKSNAQGTHTKQKRDKRSRRKTRDPEGSQPKLNETREGEAKPKEEQRSKRETQEPEKRRQAMLKEDTQS